MRLIYTTPLFSDVSRYRHIGLSTATASMDSSLERCPWIEITDPALRLFSDGIRNMSHIGSFGSSVSYRISISASSNPRAFICIEKSFLLSPVNTQIPSPLYIGFSLCESSLKRISVSSITLPVVVSISLIASDRRALITTLT